jgi:hypothetical protein
VTGLLNRLLPLAVASAGVRPQPVKREGVPEHRPTTPPPTSASPTTVVGDGRLLADGLGLCPVGELEFRLADGLELCPVGQLGLRPVGGLGFLLVAEL